ncbi:MAG: hypothetical protein JWN32_3373, partial [Solirubrobacterales bacterium]|nr:hypothetical protein [Solirubrobacterales bacterium]
MIGTYGAALAICLASIVIGRGVWALTGELGWTWLAPAVGFAVLLVACEVAIRAPGHAWTAVVVVLALVAAALWVGRRASWPPVEALVVGLLVLAATAIPFVANARVGLLGVSFNDDPASHLLLAAGLRDPALRSFTAYGPGYPVGPHAIVATLGRGLGVSLASGFNGLLVATPVLTGLTALGGLRDLAPLRRWLVALLAAVFYLSASWYAQAAYKEPILAMLLLALVLLVWRGRREGFARPWQVAIPAAVLLAGMVYAYSYTGLAWPGAFLVLWGAAELALRLARSGTRALMIDVRTRLPALGAGAAVFAAAILADFGRIHTFFTQSGGAAGATIAIPKADIGNLAGPLSVRESFGVWLQEDFRFWPHDMSQARLLAYGALAVVIFGVVRELLRRDLAATAALVGCAAIYLYSNHTQSPYVAAKALVIPAPLIALVAGRGLLRRIEARRARVPVALALGIAAVAFSFAALRSSYLALRGAEVGPGQHAGELRDLRAAVHGRPTLMLVDDDYYQYELLPVPANSPSRGSPIRLATFSPQKPWAYGAPIDFDSVDAATLDRFDYAITVRSAYQSQPPANFHLVAHSRSYDVWHRVGPTVPRRVLREAGAPGAVLDCRSAAGRRI